MGDAPLATYQNEIYLQGLGGQRPLYPIGPAQLERAAYESMTPAPPST